MRFTGLVIVALSAALLSSCSQIGLMNSSQMEQITDSATNETANIAPPADDISSATTAPDAVDDEDSALADALYEYEKACNERPVPMPEEPEPVLVSRPEPAVAATPASASAETPLPPDQAEPADFTPSPEQQAAALSMLNAQPAARSTVAAQATAAARVSAAPSAAPSQRAAAPVYYSPALPSHPLRRTLPDDMQQDSPLPPAPDPAEQRGFRSPSLPKLLPMDIDGKINS